MHELCQTHYQILLNILTEDINKNKCKECKGKCLDCMEERFKSKYKDCKCCLEYIKIKDKILKF